MVLPAFGTIAGLYLEQNHGDSMPNVEKILINVKILLIFM